MIRFLYKLFYILTVYSKLNSYFKALNKTLDVHLMPKAKRHGFAKLLKELML